MPATSGEDMPTNTRRHFLTGAAALAAASAAPATARTMAEHHWGVPTMVFNDEPFFGQDKIELLIWRLKQNGLTARVTKE